MEAFENQVTLFIFEFFDLVLSAHIVVLQLTSRSQVAVHLRVKHVRAEIKHGPFVNFIVLILTRVLLAVALHEQTHLITELAFGLANIGMVLF